tara:strand:+ start:134 stop:526 length:393 start_codon:yes stop_codon:yes gene_type:complete
MALQVAICSAFLPVGCTASTRNVKLPERTTVSGIQIDIDKVYNKSSYLNPIWGVSGVATNQNSTPLRTVQIELGAYDSTGTKIAAAFAISGTLRSDSRWRFDAPFVSVIDRNLSIDEVKIDSVNGIVPSD